MESFYFMDYSNLNSTVFENEKELEKFVQNDKDNSILCGVVFNDDDYINYSIRIKGSNIVDSKNLPYAKGKRSKIIAKRTVFKKDSSDIIYMGKDESDKYNLLFVSAQMAIDNTIV
ncbi:hypothetical protein BCR36DRAFT_158904 [Piromyces finnis]|uniref:Uncharacterized protein n=1 Tax=Piromyces finnis TaxID=1754191 RepID=A0A1Y1UWH5_9FUNG|nr:hypothetical protein BCR36DRAFT_158904 [Piromyces finnis]|eukprot:ORX42404.1 hypothetical protein BCR36DRAFT_158904 [Piromyces finnis]